MTAPFYVSPQQVLADRAEYARKGIARGRSIVAAAVEEGVLFVAENPMPTLHKLSELYDRIGFAAVGRYNEFEALRVVGVRRADLAGYSYSREDVSARSLAGFYAQTLGQVFTHELKPMEVELLIAEVGTAGSDSAHDRIYRVSFDGQIADESGVVTMGGVSEELSERLDGTAEAGQPAGELLRHAVQAIADQVDRTLGPDSLEVALLDREAQRRAFRRITGDALLELLGTPEIAPAGADDAGEDDTSAEPSPNGDATS